MLPGTRSSMESDIADQHNHHPPPTTSPSTTVAFTHVHVPPLKVPITPYRFLNIAVGLGLGIPKAVYSARSQSIISGDLDWAGGVIAFFILYVLGWYENVDNLPWIKWFFHKDLSRPICDFVKESLRFMLLDNEADVDVAGREHGTALQATSGGGDFELARLLLDREADDIAGREHGTALQAASGGGYLELVQLLLESGADVDATQGGYYGTALQAASAEGHDELVQLLLESGADVNATGREYYGTPLQAVSGGGHFELAKLLREHWAIEPQNDQDDHIYLT